MLSVDSSYLYKIRLIVNHLSAYYTPRRMFFHPARRLGPALWLRLGCSVGQAILPAAAFSGGSANLSLRPQRLLKVGCKPGLDAPRVHPANRASASRSISTPSPGVSGKSHSPRSKRTPERTISVRNGFSV